MSPLPFWRRQGTWRFGLTALLMLPALFVQGYWLDSGIFSRLIILLVTGFITSLGIRSLTSPSLPRPRLPMLLLDALLHALVLAALWPAALPLWMLGCGLIVGVLSQRLLGGWALSPFPVPVLALAVGLAIAKVFHLAIQGPLVSLLVVAGVAAAWLIAGLLLGALRLRSPWASLGFLLPALLIWSLGGIAGNALLVTAVISVVILGDPRGLPVTRSGQFILGMLAGTGGALLWSLDAPPVTAVYPLLLVHALSPWIEHHTLPHLSKTP